MPLSLKVFLTAFAIIDDIGAVLVIAIFYSSTINWLFLFYALILFLILAFLNYRKIYISYVYFFIGIIIWFLFLKSGVHPTIAGVLMAFTIPMRQKINIKKYTKKLSRLIDNIKLDSNKKDNILSANQIEEIENLELYTNKARSPLQHLEYKLHNWVAYFIIPIFALSNAGVIINTNVNIDFSLIQNIGISLFLGKFLGVLLLSYLSVKLNLTTLPKDVNFKHIMGVSFLAGVGFTMSIFIANLAFNTAPAFIDSAKIGILLTSFISGVLGYFILRLSTSEKTTLNNG